jgi:hypothetical protein
LGKARHVIRRVTVFLSAATVAVGTWLLTRGHAQVTSCNVYSSQFNGTTANAACARATSSYLSGAALTIGGAVVLILVLFALAKRARRVGWDRQLPTIPQQREHAVGSTAQ